MSYVLLSIVAPHSLHLSPWAAFAGIRNIVGMQFHPVLGALYFSNNGRDNVGDDVPDDYIAYAPVAGLDFGYPYCHRQVAVCSNCHVGIIMPHLCHDQPLPHTKCAWCCR